MFVSGYDYKHWFVSSMAYFDNLKKDDAMENMIPSTEPITEGQIGKTCELIAAQLRRHKTELPSNVVQQVLENPDQTLAAEIYAVIRKRVEVISNMIVRRATVIRNRSGAEALKATGRTMYVSDSVVAEMPNGTETEMEIVFFKLGRYVNDVDLDKEYELRGLVPVDPFTLAAVNQADPTFADDHPNCTHWKNKSDKWCYAAFRRSVGERRVRVFQSVNDWLDLWWFAGSRKEPLS